MPTVADLIARARQDLGYVEGGGSDGRSGNLTKFWQERDPALQGQSWCAVWVSDCFADIGAKLPTMDRPYGFMNVLSATNYARAHGLLDQSGHYASGSILLMGTTGGDHTGIVISDDGIIIHTIEGNTSPGESGSQINGGGVYERYRPHGSWIYGAMKTDEILRQGTVFPKPVPARPVVPSRSTVRPTRLAVDGDFGQATRRRLQQWAGVTQDSILGKQSWAAVQRKLKVPSDGSPGPVTYKALQRLVGTVPDGAFGKLSIRALQIYLNSH